VARRTLGDAPPARSQDPARYDVRLRRVTPAAPPRDGLGLMLRAAHFSAQKHRMQRRKDAEASPTINHPLGVADLLSNEAGIADPVVLAAAILHDTLEDTETSVEELVQAFGSDIALVVAEVSDDKSLPPAARKHRQIGHAGAASVRARLVKLADKTCNLREIIATPPADWSLGRKQDYFDWAKQVVDAMRGVHGTLEHLFDEVYAKRPR